MHAAFVYMIRIDNAKSLVYDVAHQRTQPRNTEKKAHIFCLAEH